MKKMKLLFASMFTAVCLSCTASVSQDVSAFVDTEVVEDLAFSKESGYYASAFSLEVSGEGIVKILYTLDGSEPVEGEASTKVITGTSGTISVNNLKNTQPVLTTDKNASEFVDGYANVQSKSSLDRATIVRAVGVKLDGTKTRISTKTYFVANDIAKKYDNCAVMSIVTDPDNLLDPDSGIYVLGNAFHNAGGGEDNIKLANFYQKGKDWERSSFMEFFDGSNTPVVQQGIGIRIHGGYSRRNQQKSLNIYFREDYEYGQKNLKGYELIPNATVLYDDDDSTYVNKTLKKFANVMLRNGGNDSDISKFQDIFIQNMVSDRDFATQGARPCMLYLNGEYWGLYNLTEKFSDKQIQNKYGVDNNNVIVYKADGKKFELDEGEDPDSAALNELMALGNLDMTKEENYKKFQELVDEESFIDYYATEIYINNNDWWSGCNADTSMNNIEIWRVADPALEVNEDGSVNPYADGKWRYMLYDTEWSMGIYGSRQASAEYDSIKHHALGIPDPNNNVDDGRTEANGSPLFTALFKNTEFRKKFAMTFLDIRNYNFNYDRCLVELRRLRDLYTPLMESHSDRWRNGNVNSGYNNMKSFVSARAPYVLSMLESNMSELKSSNRVNVMINSNVADKISVNSVNPEVSPAWFTGVYYKNYPIIVKADEVEGYTFSNWKVEGGTATEASSLETEIKLTAGNAKITAVYKDENGAEPTIAPTPTPTPTPTPRPQWGGGGNWGGNWGATATPKPQKTAAPTVKPSQTPVPSLSVQPTAAPVPGDKNTNDGVISDDVIGKTYTVKNIVYTVTSANEVKVSAPAKKTLKTIVIPASVVIEGKTYNVTSIADNAFKNCKKLKKITIGENITSIGKNAFRKCTGLKNMIVSSKKIKSIGTSCFKGVNKKIKVTVPKTKYKAYKKLFVKKGLKKTVKFKKK